MKVLQIHNTYQQYGGEDAVLQREFEILKNNGIKVDQILFNNDQVNITDVIYNYKSAKILKKKIQSFRPDIIHIHNIFYKASPSIIKVSKQMGIPVVMTLHNFRLLCPSAFFIRDNSICTKCKNLRFPLYAVKYKCFKESYSKTLVLSISLAIHKFLKTWNRDVSKFIVLTPFIREIILDSSLKLNPDKIVVKANSTDDNYDGIDKIDLRKNFLFVGRISKEKGIDILIEAFKKLPQTSLNVIGDGELLDNLKSIATPNITFHGKKDSEFIKKYLKTSKALIVPSVWYEGLPNTIIESFSSGTPVICSDIDNLNSLVKNEFNGMLFKTGNSISLASTIKDFDTFSKTYSFYTNARKTFLTNYTHDINFKNLMNLYNNLINEKKNN